MTVVLAFAVVVFFGLLVKEFYSWYRLSHVPGPFWHGITGFSMARAALNGSVHEYYMELHEKYGMGASDLNLDAADKLIQNSRPLSSYRT